jgi:hypothetical protein
MSTALAVEWEVGEDLTLMEIPQIHLCITAASQEEELPDILETAETAALELNTLTLLVGVLVMVVGVLAATVMPGVVMDGFIEQDVRVAE